MFAGDIKITLRNIYREKLYTLINIAGLSLGITCCVILALYLRSELTYDQHHLNHKQIFRVVNEFNANGKLDDFAVTSTALGPLLIEDFPEIKDFVRLWPSYQKRLYRHQDQAYLWDRVYVADPNVFKIFTHHVLYGDPETALDDPYAVAVSRTFARTYFGDENPLGKIIHPESGDPYKITLVFDDLPENTHLKYDFLSSSNHPDNNSPDNITGRRQLLYWVNTYTYLLMDEGYEVDKFKNISDEFFATHMKARGEQMNWTWRSWLEPLADVHLHSQANDRLPLGNSMSLYGFAAVAVFILVVACINYMNLATARYAKRSREVGMRKIIGADRGQLILQFLAEAMILTFIATVFGVVMIEALLSTTSVTTLLDKSLNFDWLDEPLLVGALTGLALVIGLFSGLYPALYLSSVAPLTALAGSDRTGKSKGRLRSLLVLIQFTITVGVIACTLLMAAQMKYISDKSLGYNKENKIVINMRGLDVIEQYPALKTELLKNSNILGMATSANMLGQGTPTNGAQVENNVGVMESTTFNHMAVEGTFFEVMGMQIDQGRDFSTRLLTDIGRSYVVNETFVKHMGWDDPIGKRIQLGQGGKVIGVVKDFNYLSLHNEIRPFAMYPFNDNFENVPARNRTNITRFLVLNIAGEDIRGTLEYVEDIYLKFDQIHPFEFEFLDDSLNQLYISEERLMKLTGIFAGICIFIACLGLFGLASFTTEQRTREIGVRKILGSSTLEIIVLLSRNILLLVISGAVIASILSWYAMDEWLSGFAYHTDINPFVFPVSALLAAVVAFITLALQTYKTARANPVEALRYE